MVTLIKTLELLTLSSIHKVVIKNPIEIFPVKGINILYILANTHEFKNNIIELTAMNEFPIKKFALFKHLGRLNNVINFTFTSNSGI